MFGKNSDVLTQEYLDRTDGASNGGGGEGRRSFDHGPTPAASNGAPKEKWSVDFPCLNTLPELQSARRGDGVVGVNNNGVNGRMCAGGSRSGIAIELGSGCAFVENAPDGVGSPFLTLSSLAKTKHLLQPMARLLQSAPGVAAPFQSIEYKALDVEPQSLVSTLTKLVQLEPASVTSVADGTPRVVVGGIAATYDEGLEHFRQHPSTEHETRSLLWLGSSIGNFSRPEAAEFLKKIADTVLHPGDTFAIGVDNCADGDMISAAYDDPQVCLLQMSAFDSR